MTVSLGSGGFSQSPFTVSSVAGQARYSTIQAAVTAAVGAGGSNIYIQPGTYNESISWPAGLNIQSSAAGNGAVIINGNQTFSAAGTIIFNTISFTASAGNTFTVNNGSALPDFQTCNMTNTGAGNTLVITNAQIAIINQSAISANTGISISQAAGISTILSSAIGSLANTTSTAVSLTGTAAMGVQQSSVYSGGSQDTVSIGSAAASYTSFYNNYISGGAAWNFLAAGLVYAEYDIINALGTNYAAGAAGTLNYSLLTFLGSTSVAAGITDTALPNSVVVTPPSALVWNNNATSGALAVNNGYIITSGAQSFTLPATAAIGDVIEMVLQGGTSWTITLAGQTINGIAGGGPVALTTSVASNDTDSTAMRIVCTTTNTAWNIDSLIGTLTGS